VSEFEIKCQRQGGRVSDEESREAREGWNGRGRQAGCQGGRKGGKEVLSEGGREGFTD